MTHDILGPFLTLDTVRDDRMHLAAVFIAPEAIDVPPLRAGGIDYTAHPLAHIGDRVVHRIRFDVPAVAPSHYDWNETRFALVGDLNEDLNLAFASCNGEELGDMERDPDERNAMWQRLATQHRKTPFTLLLHGGDQIYADEATLGHKLSHGWPDSLPRDPSRTELEDLRQHLRQRFLDRYTAQLAAKDYAWLVARVPSLAQWDDHDICDGWGSLRRAATYSPVGQVLYEVALEMTLLFQHGAVAGDLPARFDDPQAGHLGWWLDFPGVRIIAPDLRGERTRRQIMGHGGWHMMDALAQRPAPARTLMLSSVPLLGPRLSILEAAMVVVPRMQKYEDDLRDQWQSRAHRAEWRRMLEVAGGMMRAHDTDMTVLSGEIHLAARAEMQVAPGRMLHQLVASGITHRPPPKGWARVLGALASVGESPLPNQPIRIRRIPGQATRYVAERNALVLTRRGAEWHATWDFEHSGRSPELRI